MTTITSKRELHDLRLRRNTRRFASKQYTFYAMPLCSDMQQKGNELLTQIIWILASPVQLPNHRQPYDEIMMAATTYLGQIAHVRLSDGSPPPGAILIGVLVPCSPAEVHPACRMYIFFLFAMQTA